MEGSSNGGFVNELGGGILNLSCTVTVVVIMDCAPVSTPVVREGAACDRAILLSSSPLLLFVCSVGVSCSRSMSLNYIMNNSCATFDKVGSDTPRTSVLTGNTIKHDESCWLKVVSIFLDDNNDSIICCGDKVYFIVK